MEEAWDYAAVSRRTRELRLEAEEQWPALHRFLASCFPETETSIAGLVSKSEIAQLKAVAREWWDWNGKVGADHDPRAAIEHGLGIGSQFEKPEDARRFMNSIYDIVILAIRKQDKGWKP